MDMYPIFYSTSLYMLGLGDDKFFGMMQQILVGQYRIAYNFLALYFIPYFIFTIDKNGTETGFDLVKDFTALLILIEIDNMLLSSKLDSVEDLTEVMPIHERLKRAAKWQSKSWKEKFSEFGCKEIFIVIVQVLMGFMLLSIIAFVVVHFVV